MTPKAAENAYWNLVVAAQADYGISPEEQKVLNAHVVKLGLDPSHARALQAAAEAQPTPLLRAADGLDAMRALLDVAAADGSISPAELAVARALADSLRITRTGLDSLVKAALSRSPARRDKAFDRVKSEPAPTADIRFLAPVAAAPTGGLLRTLPFAARLASPQRACVRCKLPFADANPYLKTCKVCLEKRKVRAGPTALMHETLFVVLCVLLFLPVAYLVQKTTGLWSWGFEAASQHRSQYTGYSRRRRSGAGVYILPALGVTALLTFLPAWGLTWLALRLFRKSPTS